MTEDQRDRLLLAGVNNVAFDGWTEEAFRRGAEDLGLDPDQAEELLPAEPRALVAAFSDWADRSMLEALAKEDLSGLGTTAKVALALRLRFEALEPYQEAVRRSLSVLSRPTGALSGMTLLHRTADAIWNALGDQSVDHNWYTKRMLLGGVISSSTLYWLQDGSEGKERTWAFIDRRLRDVVRVGGRLGKVASRALALPDRLVRRMQARREWGRRAH